MNSNSANNAGSSGSSNPMSSSASGSNQPTDVLSQSKDAQTMINGLHFWIELLIFYFNLFFILSFKRNGDR